MRAQVFSAQTADVVSEDYNISGSKKFMFMFQKTGAGTCTITLRWKISDGPFDVIPLASVPAGHVYSIAGGAQEEQILIDNYGADKVQVEISATAAPVSVDGQLGCI